MIFYEKSRDKEPSGQLRFLLSTLAQYIIWFISDPSRVRGTSKDAPGPSTRCARCARYEKACPKSHDVHTSVTAGTHSVPSPDILEISSNFSSGRDNMRQGQLLARHALLLCFSCVVLLSSMTTPSVAEGSPRGAASGVNISYILNSFQIGYDRRVRPNYGGIPVTVGVTLYILSIGDLSEKFMDFTFDMYFRQFWSDPRLSFDRHEFGIDQLVVGAEYIKLIWVPDTFFVNEKIALFHEATTENEFLRITHEGVVLRSMRLTIKATCPMNLANFPMDSQMCTVEIESFGYTMADLKYAWNDGETSVKMSPDVALPQFLVLGHRQRLIEVSLSSGNYSRLLADVQFTRSMGYYMIQVSFLLYTP